MRVHIRAWEYTVDATIMTKRSLKMDCKRKIYKDGEYTLCGGCNKAGECRYAKHCFGCGRADGVAYESRWDVFACGSCLEKLAAGDKK